MKSLNHYRDICHAAAHNWWHDADGNPVKRNDGELLMLVVSELAEANEGIRKNLWDDKLPNRTMEEVEMADTFIRMCDYCGSKKWDLNGNQSPINISDHRPEALFDIVALVDEIRLFQRPRLASVFLNSIISYCAKFQLDLDGAIAEKMAYNSTRYDHTHAARAADGGKKF